MSWSIMIGALLLDQVFGEVKRFHPLVGFGNSANWCEQRFNHNRGPVNSILRGSACVATLVLPWVGLTALLIHLSGPYYLIIDLLLIYWAVGLKSLTEHVKPIQSLLQEGKIPESRRALARIVSRDTDHLDAGQISAAAIESTLENGCDSLFASLFWYMLGGAPCVVAHRLINTLDAMWGYRTERHEYFGKAAARLDDLVNYVPARLTALSYAICGNTTVAIKSWFTYARKLSSPNAGPVMCAGAGALELKLGGDAFYQQYRLIKPSFGGANRPKAGDITRANKLLLSATVLWCALGLVWTLCSKIMPGLTT